MDDRVQELLDELTELCTNAGCQITYYVDDTLTTVHFITEEKGLQSVKSSTLIGALEEAVKVARL